MPDRPEDHRRRDFGQAHDHLAGALGARDEVQRLRASARRGEHEHVPTRGDSCSMGRRGRVPVQPACVPRVPAGAVGVPRAAVLPVSAVEGIGMDALLSELGDIMREEDDARVQTIREGPARRETTGEGTNMKIRF